MRRLIAPLLWMVIGGLIVLTAQRVHFVPGVPRAAPAAPPAAQVTIPSRLAMPVAGVAPAALSDSFADPRAEGRTHGAIDIMAPLGTPVIAAAPGTVEKIFESVPGGHTVYVRSPDRSTIYYYAHLDRYADGLRQGLYLTAGAPIGSVGATGNADSAAPHLHFEVKRMAPGDRWDGGTAVDPYPLLAAGRSGR